MVGGYFLFSFFSSGNYSFLFKCSNSLSYPQFQRNEVFLMKIVIRPDPVIWDFAECYAWLYYAISAEVCTFSFHTFALPWSGELVSSVLLSGLICVRMLLLYRLLSTLWAQEPFSLFSCFSLSLSLISWVAKLSLFYLPSVLMVKLKHFLHSEFLFSVLFFHRQKSTRSIFNFFRLSFRLSFKRFLFCFHFHLFRGAP